MKRFRSPAAVICGVLCVAGLVAGITYVYLARVLFEPDWFADRAAASLAQPRVARVVAGQATDQIIAYRRELTAYRPLLLGTLEYVVASAPVRAVVRRTATELHAKLISDTGDDILFTVGDLGVVARNALAAYPEIAAKIPEKAQVALGNMKDWPWAKTLLKVMRLGNRLRTRAAVGIGLGLLCGAAGVLLTRRKDRYLLRLGMGLAITSFAMAGVFRFGGGLAALFSRTDIGAELMRGIWPVFLGPLAIRLLILGGLGIVLVAAVTSLLEKVEPIQFARQWLGRALHPRVRPGWGFLRGVVLVALGLLVLYHPTLFLLILAVVAGSVLLYEGVQELFVTAVRFAPRVEGSAPQAQPAGRSSSPGGVIMVAALAVLLIGGGAFWLAKHSRDDVAVAGPVTVCNGHPELCDRPLNQVVFATAHNAMSAADIANWMFPNHERGVAAQLADGVRGFLIDIHYGVPVGDRVKTLIENEEAARAKYEEALGKEGIDAALRIRDRLVGEDLGKRDVYLGHGFCELGAQKFTDWLEILRDFLIANPGEVVIMVLQDEGVAPADVARCFAETGLEDLVYRGPVTAPWPTLGEMVARDERVVVYAENNAEGVPWYHLMGGNIQETPYRFHDPSQFSNVPNRGGTNGSLLMMNHWIETAPASNPKNAEIVNAYDFLLARARACQKERGMLPNLVAVDFYRSGDLIRVVNTLNGVTEGGNAPLP
jgi:hypothetical protein